jgi:hypothetical protein
VSGVSGKTPEATLASARAFLYAASIMLLTRHEQQHGREQDAASAHEAGQEAPYRVCDYRFTVRIA